MPSMSAGPKSLLHYEIIETLGTGGNGTVYRARNTENGDIVAIKTLKNVSEITLTRFKREFFALKKMDHQGIIKVFDGFFEHDPPFFSMEWVKGKTLSQMIQDLEDNPMVFSVADRENFAIRMALQTCEILTYIHSFDEVHRDLKPDNLFITLAGNNILSDFSVKMLDFGLLKAVNDSEGGEDTDSGMIVGTVHYLSPEQAKGTQLDLRSDLFSLGIIMYKIISLKLPYEASDVVGYIFKTVFEDPAPIESQTDEVSKKMSALLRDLLAREPGKRPPAAAALKRRLNGLLAPKEPSFQMDITAADLDFSTGLEGFGSPLLPPPLTGREGAVKKLESMAAELSGRPVAAILEGEPGMGRSSMIKEWRTRIKFSNPIFLQGHFPEEIIPTQDPIGMLIDSLVRTLKPEEVRKLFRDVYPFLSSVSRYLGRYFDTRSVGKFDHLSPGRKLQVLAVNFIKLLASLSMAKGPVIIILDDVQNAPERFFGWLTLFWEQLGNLPVMILFSCSLDPSRRAFNQFRARLLDGPDNLEIELKPLDADQTVQLLQSMLPIGAELPFSAKLIKLLMERANGNPYYAIELFSTLYEEDQVFISKGVLDVHDTDGLDVPLSIHQALLKKVNRLPDQTRLLLKAAAVLGHAFDYPWLVAVLRWPDEQMISHLNTLIRLGILSEEELPVHKLYFNAPALQKIIYDQIPAKERAFLHNNTAKSIEPILGNDHVLGFEQIAHHYAKGDNHVRAVKYAYLAGNSALEAKDTDRAVYFYELSLKMMDAMENNQARNLVSLKLAEVHLANEKPEKALTFYNESLRSPTLSRMEKLRTLRGRMICHQKLDQLGPAHDDALALSELGAGCSKRIQAETRLARGHYGWLATGDAQGYVKEVFKANIVYNKLPHWQVRTAFVQLLANDVLEANKRLTSLVKSKYEPHFPVYLMLAFIRYFMGDFKKAKSYLAKAREGGDEGHTLDPHWMVAHALLTYKVHSTLAPDHSADEYLSIAHRYIDRFGLRRMKIKVTLAQLEHFLMTGRYEEAWQLTAGLVKKSPDLPLEHFDYHMFLILTVRSAWEVQERPPRGWLLKLQRYTPGEDAPFLLHTHWALAKATEAGLPLSMGGPKALAALKDCQKLLIKTKTKYYYRATLIKEINLMRTLGQLDQMTRLDKLRRQIDASIDADLPDR